LTADLRRERTSGNEDEPARPLGPRGAHARDERDAERDGLARPGWGATAEVAAGEAVGHGHGLDVERVDETARAEGTDELGGNAELGEGGAGHGGGSPGGLRAAQTGFGRVDEPRNIRSVTDQQCERRIPTCERPGR